MTLTTKSRLLSTTVVPFVFGLGLVAAGCAEDTAGAGGSAQYAAACKACGACKACNPCAAACGACNPCNPCAAACGACSPCSPCGAAACGASAVTECVVPRIACNPCAAACSPCSPCSPCGAACNPCSPCAAAACNPCNPCAAAACSPCNPCAAAACNPCNPCAAAACGPCSPCNPCAAGGGAELTDAEARAAYDCVQSAMVAAYSRSGVATAREFSAWTNYATSPYTSATHGGRYVNNYANPTGSAYGRYEQAGTMPSGAVLAKPSFTVNNKGQVVVGPLFLMAKQDAGWNPDTLDWQYQMIMPDGTVFGTTNGPGSAKVQFCADCHNAMADQDALMLLPDQYRR